MMLLQKFVVFFIVSFVVMSQVHSQPYNRISESNVTHKWFEVGFKLASDVEWSSVTTNNREWQENIVVFISLPSFGGSHYSEGKMIAPKMQQEASKNSDGSYSFSFKLVQANDSFCELTWSTPTFLGETQLSWMVMEKGAYYIDGHPIIVGSGDINRVDNSGSATVANGNAVRLNYPTGCEGNVNSPCAMTGVNSQAELGALQQLQTSVNTIDNGNDLFLSVRTRVVNIRHIQLVIFPHSSSEPSFFEITTPEVVAYLVFSSFEFVCLESMVFETAIYEGVTSSPIHVDFFHNFDYIPGLFGTLGSTVSLVDATTVRSFNSSTTGSNYITQEDQCDTEQTDHVTEERVFVFIVGEAAGSSSTFSCNVVFNSAVNTGSPSVAPSALPSPSPTLTPTSLPTSSPTVAPTTTPTARPTISPTVPETASPTEQCNAAEFEVKFTKTPKTIR